MCCLQQLRTTQGGHDPSHREWEGWAEGYGRHRQWLCAAAESRALGDAGEHKRKHSFVATAGGAIATSKQEELSPKFT